MAKPADKQLLRAVLEPRQPGAMQKIAGACSAGADPNAICPECSTAAGPVRAGSTLLTHSIHEEASKAVAKLLECGADPNLVDQNGWSPWMASTLVDESKRRKIQGALTEYGADQTGAHIGELARAIAAGDTEHARSLIESDEDMQVLSTFRVDLVGHQVRSANTPMLELLLERGMTPTSTHLINAIRSRSIGAVDALLRHGMAPERADESETPLMTAAAMGLMAIVERLVESGADVNRSSDDDGEWTPSFYARQAGKADVAEWLDARMGEATLASRDQRQAARDPKYQLVYDRATSGEGISTDDIVAALTRWDESCGVAISDANANSIAIVFSSAPEDPEAFFEEVVSLCPDVSEDQQALLDTLTSNRKLFLWWD